MNIVRFVDYFPPFSKIRYGLGPTYYYLSREQVKLGINVDIICKGYPREKRFEEMEGIRVHRVIVPYNVSALYELIKLDRRLKVDLVHAHATACLSYGIFKKLLHPGRKGVNYVVHVHGTTKGVIAAYKEFLPSVLNGPAKEHIQRQLSSLRQVIMWNRANALVAVSKSVARELKNLYDIAKEKTHIAYNGVDLQTFYPRKSKNKLLKMFGLPPDCHILLYLGGFRPVKGPTYLIKALGRIREKLGNAKVLFVGNPRHPLESYYVRPVINLVKRLKINDAIRMVDNIPYHQMPDYYSAADALLLPSIYDSFPKVALEAMACGTPVLASNVGGLKELIRNGETGVLVKPASPNELAEAIVNIVSNVDLREKLGLKARRLVEEKFTWAHVAKRIMAIYQELLRGM